MSSTWPCDADVPAAPDEPDDGPRPAPSSAELLVEHETCYAYASPVLLAHHLALLQPRDDGPQRRLAHALQIEPAPAERHDGRDVYGNARCHFTLTAPHEALRVVARSRVVVSAATAPTAAAVSWDVARERWRYRSGRPLCAANEFVFDSPRIACDAALADWARACFPPGAALDAGAHALMTRLHEEFAYEPASTEVDTPLQVAFAQRRGVCQDFAHVMIGALRSLGLAARYVSGYLLTDPPVGQPRLQGADASHAWVAVALPREDGTLDWLELDPTNACAAAQSHVRLAWGRDYGDVTPLRGVIRGGGPHRLTVRVGTHPADEP